MRAISEYARFSTVADAAGAVQQRLARGDVPVARAIQAHLLLHRFHLIARRLDEVAPAGQLGAVDLELVRILLDNRCWSEWRGFGLRVKGKIPVLCLGGQAERHVPETGNEGRGGGQRTAESTGHC